jgi:hypothetical protein
LNGKFLLADVIYFAIVIYIIYKSYNKGTRLEHYAIYIVPILFLCFSVINLMRFENQEAFFSQIRYIFNYYVFSAVVFYFLIYEKRKESFIYTYECICCFFSLFVIVQFFSYYILGVNIPFDFGSYSLEENVASIYNPLDAFLYRTGGFFKEPSWFALFVAPVLDIAYKQKHHKIFQICILGLILSTSSLAILLIAVFFLLRLKQLKFLILFLLCISAICLIFPDIFERLLQGGSLQIRVLEPFDFFFKANSSSFIGIDVGRFYFFNGEIFLNTFVFTYLAFGTIGLLFFLFFFKLEFSLYTSIAMLAIVMIEGCYGRIDFWMALAACFVSNLFFMEKASNAYVQPSKLKG